MSVWWEKPATLELRKLFNINIFPGMSYLYEASLNTEHNLVLAAFSWVASLVLKNSSFSIGMRIASDFHRTAIEKQQKLSN